MQSSPIRLGLSRALCLASFALAALTVVFAATLGPCILTGALSIGLAASGGTVHKQSTLAPAVFLIDGALLVVAAGIFMARS